MMLSTAFLSTGCSIVTRGSDYCYRFLDYICEGSFDKAYEMLADSIKAPETEKEREDRLKEEEKAKGRKPQNLAAGVRLGQSGNAHAGAFRHA